MCKVVFFELLVLVVFLVKGMVIFSLFFIGNIDMERVNYLMEEVLKLVNRL